jgi:hypothetical protein
MRCVFDMIHFRSRAPPQPEALPVSTGTVYLEVADDDDEVKVSEGKSRAIASAVARAPTLTVDTEEKSESAVPAAAESTVTEQSVSITAAPEPSVSLASHGDPEREAATAPAPALEPEREPEPQPAQSEPVAAAPAPAPAAAEPAKPEPADLPEALADDFSAEVHREVEAASGPALTSAQPAEPAPERVPAPPAPAAASAAGAALKESEPNDSFEEKMVVSVDASEWRELDPPSMSVAVRDLDRLSRPSPRQSHRPSDDEPQPGALGSSPRPSVGEVEGVPAEVDSSDDESEPAPRGGEHPVETSVSTNADTRGNLSVTSHGAPVLPAPAVVSDEPEGVPVNRACRACDVRSCETGKGCTLM